MAKRRMFSLDVIDTDQFLDMETTARLLYYELGMRADDDGFVASPKRIMRTVGCNQNDLDELIGNGYVIQFRSGVIVISHWKLQNTIQSDRYNETIYTDEKSLLVEINKKYSLKADVNNMETNCIQNDSETEHDTETQYSLEEDSVEQNKTKKEKQKKNNSNHHLLLPEAERIAKLFESICVSFPKPIVSEVEKAIADRGVDYDYESLFRRAEKSDFLSGRNNKATRRFPVEWIIANADRINSGMYDNPKHRDCSFDIEAYEKNCDLDYF